ncbi:MAG: TIGR04255 family protein [Polyangiaceae bacterium]
MDYPKLSRAPITEALVDIRLSEPVSEDVLPLVHERVSGEFPETKPRNEVQLTWDTASLDSTSKVTAKGWLGVSEEKRHAMQARTDGFIFSRLAPYDDWPELRTSARACWEHYVAATNAQHVRQIGVRYINRIELPAPVKDFDDYFKTFPRIGDSIQQSIASMFMRIVIPHPVALVAITETIDSQGITESVVPVILDILTYIEGPFPATGEEIWEQLDRLRTAKNQAFFGSITEKTWRMFE